MIVIVTEKLINNLDLIPFDTSDTKKITIEEPYQPIDLLISNWAMRNNRQRLYYIPSLFQHIGLWSTSEYKRFAQKRHLKLGHQILNYKSSDSFERYFSMKS